LEAIAG
jgi:structural maintenance of chromosome 2